MEPVKEVVAKLYLQWMASYIPNSHRQWSYSGISSSPPFDGSCGCRLVHTRYCPGGQDRIWLRGVPDSLVLAHEPNSAHKTITPNAATADFR